MDATFNVTYITVGGHVEMGKYRYLYFVFMLLVYVLILVSNCTIICLIWIHRNLHEPMYIFIAALSVNSVLFSTDIYPKFLIDILSETRIISYSACLFQFFLFYSSVGADFSLLTAMAYDRYVSICKPLQYQTIMGKITVIVLLFLSWFLPVCLISPVILLRLNKKLCSFNLNDLFCTNFIDNLLCDIPQVLLVYIIIPLVTVILLPILFIFFSYTKILIVTFHSQGVVRRKAAETCLPHLLVLISISFVFVFHLVLPQVEKNISRPVHYTMSVQMIMCNPLLNPFIYGLKMKEISKHLKKLFCGDKLKQFIHADS
ncbi:LOW QUALITY PROTEIN: olfactory receptor 11A1-like [Lampetra planeri]